jgi:LPS O-antigen subunit length determinant protein (WzzB/FepE family)
MDVKDSLLGVLGAVYRWRKQILGLSIIAAVGTAVISLFLPNFYQAKAIVLAANSEQARPENLYSESGGTYFFGGGDDIDRLMTIAESNELADYLIDTFNLFEHYKVDPNWPKAYHYTRLKLHERMKVTKTKRDAIEFSLEDQDPELVPRMVNAACQRINTLSKEVMRAGQRKTLNSYELSIAAKESQVRDMSDSLKTLRSKYKVYNTKQLSLDLTARYAQAKGNYLRMKGKLESMLKNRGVPADSITTTRNNAAGYAAEVAGLEAEMENLSGGEADLMLLETQYYSINGQLGDELERAKQLRAALASDIPALVVLEAAEKPIVKSRPRRSILVITAGILAFVVGVLGVLFIEAYREINWREVFHEQR